MRSYSIITSQKPAAKAFKKSVTSEILPSIRKTGGYGIPHETQQLIQTLQNEVLRKNPRLHDVKRLLQAGFIKARAMQMLGISETTFRRDLNKLKACGLVPVAAQQLELSDGV